MEQHFEGSIQGGQFGNIQNHNHYEQKPIRTKPRIAVVCPQCRHETWRYNELCNSEAGCTFGIRAYFDALEQQERERKEAEQKESARRFYLRIGSVGLVVCILLSYIGTEWLDSPIMAFGFLVGLFWYIFWLNVADAQTK